MSVGDDSLADPAADALHQAAIDFRDRLLARNWLEGKRVAGLVGAHPESSPDQYAACLRSEGKLLGVWSAPERSFLHPDFQFDRLGTIRPAIAELLPILPDKDDRGGWQRAFWLHSPHALLGGRLPADVFVVDPQRGDRSGQT